MTQISILEGIYVGSAANLRTSYPINLEPRVTPNGLSNGYLHQAPGIAEVAVGPGEDRGAIVWQEAHYRVMGTKFVRIDGTGIFDEGDVGPGGPVTFDYSFDRLGIASGGRLYYWNGTTLQQVTDPDLGTVVDFVWVDGYFMTTDGSHLVVTELNDPFAVNPLKYGASEADPDPVTGLMKVRNEVYAINRFTIENFQNVGGEGFPFQRNVSGLIPKGCIGTHAKAYLLQTFAFVGGGRDEAISVYLAGNGEAISISTPEIDRILSRVADQQLAFVEAESRVDMHEQRFMIHLPDQTLVYSHQASQAAGKPVWHRLAGGTLLDKPYPGRHHTRWVNTWFVGSPSGQLGAYNDSIETLFGETAGWQFDTMFIYNEGRGGILRALELHGSPGSAPIGDDPTAFLSITLDGRTWGQETAIKVGGFGQTRKRMQWRPKRHFWNYCGCRFRGASTAIASFMRLEADIEPLNA